MKLAVYDSTTQSSRFKSPSIRITKAGVIYLNIPALELMHLSENDTVSFANDEDSPKDWFIFRDAKGMKITRKSGSKDNKVASLGIANQNLCRKIRDTLKLADDKNYSFLLAGQPTNDNGHNLWAILTSSVKK